MPWSRSSPALIALALLSSAGGTPWSSASAQPGSFKATVVSVGDGDTLSVRAAGSTITIRLACIDAPETFQNPWGQQSRAYLRQWLPVGRQVQILPHGTDRFRRTVAEVISDSNINLVMVEDGQAFAYRQFMKGCDRAAYLDAELRARRRRHGIWRVEGGITRPWDLRRRRRGGLIEDGSTPGGQRYRCREIGSHARAQELLKQGHTYLDSNGDGEACETLR